MVVRRIQRQNHFSFASATAQAKKNAKEIQDLFALEVQKIMLEVGRTFGKKGKRTRAKKKKKKTQKKPTHDNVDHTGL